MQQLLDSLALLRGDCTDVALISMRKLAVQIIKAKPSEQSDVGLLQVDLESYGVQQIKRRSKWQERIGIAVGRACGCRCLTRNGSNEVWFVGGAADRRLAADLFGALVGELSEFTGREYHRLHEQHLRKGEKALMRGWRRKFIASYVESLEAQLKSAQSAGNVETSLALADEYIKDQGDSIPRLGRRR